MKFTIETIKRGEGKEAEYLAILTHDDAPLSSAVIGAGPTPHAAAQKAIYEHRKGGRKALDLATDTDRGVATHPADIHLLLARAVELEDKPLLSISGVKAGGTRYWNRRVWPLRLENGRNGTLLICRDELHGIRGFFLAGMERVEVVPAQKAEG